MGARAARAGSRDEPGPQGAEAVGGRDLPSPAGHRSPLRLALLTPGGGSRDPGEEDEKEEGKAAGGGSEEPTSPPPAPPDHRQTLHPAARAAFVRTRHFRAPACGAAASSAPDRFAPPRGRLTSVDFWVPGRTSRTSKSLSAAEPLLPPARAPVRLEAEGWAF